MTQSEDETFRILQKTPRAELIRIVYEATATGGAGGIGGKRLQKIFLDNHWTVQEGIEALLTEISRMSDNAQYNV